MGDLQFQDVFIRMLLATAVGMAIGLEREWREKAAGFRTLALVSLGSATFLLVGEMLVPQGGARVAAGVVTGIGFLGAGAILRERGEVIGLTTAAAVWMAAALGLVSAVGQVFVALVGLALALLVLLLFPIIDVTRFVRDVRVYEIEYRSAEWRPEELSSALREAGLSVTPARVDIAAGGAITVAWRATGRPERHHKAMHLLACDDSIVRLSVS